MKRGLFVDRDGTLIVDKDYLNDPNGVEWIPGVLETLKLAQTLGFEIVIVSNQSGVGRGKISIEEHDAVKNKVLSDLTESGVSSVHVYQSFATPDDRSTDRKPELGMGLTAIQQLRIDPKNSVMVGDKEIDIEFGNRLGMTSIAVRSGHEYHGTKHDFCFDNLAEASTVLQSMASNPWRSERVQDHFQQIQAAFDEFSKTSEPSVQAASVLIADAFSQGKKLLLCGNGGSAADAQHIAAEFISRLTGDLERKALPAIALTTDTSTITAYANDYDFDGIYQRQVEALGQPGDVLFAISTSGNSKNVVRAVEMAKEKGLYVISSTGQSGVLRTMANVAIELPGKSTMRIQECQLMSYHILCDLVEQILFCER
jgi:D-sedoheptulose 7-phosphate isomerase